MKLQEIIIYLILAVCICSVVIRTYRTLKGSKGESNPCAHCASGCDLKRSLEAKQKQCSNKTPKKKKSCCG